MVVLAGLGDCLEVGPVHTFPEDLAAQELRMRMSVAFGGDAVDAAAAVNIGYSLELDVVVCRLSSAACNLMWRGSSQRVGFGEDWRTKGSMEPMTLSLEYLHRTADAAEDLEVFARYLMNRIGFDFAALGTDMLLVVLDRNNLH